MGGTYKELRLWLRECRAVFMGHHEWRQLRASMVADQRRGTTNRLLIVPCDPWSVVGSRGDEAMIVAVVQQITAKYPNSEIAVVTANEKGSIAVRALGLTPLQAWRGPRLLHGICAAFERFDPDWAVILGADVMDGYYSPSTSLALTALADVLARSGCRTSILGFSFNSAPSRSLEYAFAKLSPQVKVNVRDPISLERFTKFTPTKARLVSDAAFMLRPENNFPEYQTAVDWVNQQHQAGNHVLVINVHPMLIKDARNEQVLQLAATFADVLARLAATRPVSFLFLPHDYRGHVGDHRCLGPMFEQLSPILANRVFHLAEEHSATELKALAGLADGVISSRMHLAIAALGMGVPVFVLTYQDKFQGLFRHFDLPEWLMMPAPRDTEPAELLARLERFVDELSVLRIRVAEKWPAVLELSRLNLDM